MTRTALCSVTDKTGLVPFAKRLQAVGFRLLSTGGTAELLRRSGIEVTDVAAYTGSPELFDGRVKSLHPKVHGGILHDRSNQTHVAQAREHSIEGIDLVIGNLYNFADEARSQSMPLAQAIEHIDIGGPAMLRAAAKNFLHCAAVIDPRDYERVAQEWEATGNLHRRTREYLSAKTFAAISRYDAMIADYFAEHAEGQPADTRTFPENHSIALQKISDLRYGENPHQRAAWYAPAGETPSGFADVKVLQGKELSYNNLLDLDGAAALAADLYPTPAVAIIKHTNACGVAWGEKQSLAQLYTKALACDTKSAFGGIVATNQPVDGAAATAMSEIFLECVIAPDFTTEALTIFQKKTNLRLVKAAFLYTPSAQERLQVRSLRGSYLVQSEDQAPIDSSKWRCVTKTQPSPQQLADLRFAMIVGKHVKSNSVIYTRDGVTLAVGAGQMSRIDAAEFAAGKAKSAGRELKGSAMASEAFFPFRDTVDFAAKVGVAALVQPGGSMRDQESIDACNEHGLVMMFTGQRHFKH